MAINRDKVYDGAIKLLQASKYDKAIVEFQKLIAEDGKDVRTLLKIAETLHVKMGKRKEALEHYDRAANIYTEQGFFMRAVAVFKQMLTIDGTNPDIHLRLAELYQQLNHGSQCLLHYQHVVQLYEQQDRSSDTLGILKRMVDLDPENLQSRIKVAELFAQSGQMLEANTEIRSAYDFLKIQQRHDDALRVGEKVLAWDPNATDVARELANVYMARGDAKQALPKLQMCFRLDPRNLEVLDLIAKAFLALEQTPKTISVYKEMARIYEGNNDSFNARTAWERVLELSPGDDDAETALGLRSASLAVVVPRATTVAKASPEDDQLARLLTETDVYVKYGLREKAIEHLDKIFSIRPDHIPGLEKLKQLQTQTKQPAAVVETLKRLILRGEELGHPKVAEWRAELARGDAPRGREVTAATKQVPPAARRDFSSEGEVFVVDEEAPPAPPAVALRSSPVAQPVPPTLPTFAAPPAGRPDLIRGRPADNGIDPRTMLQARPGAMPNMLASLDEPLEPATRPQTRSASPSFSMASPLDASGAALNGHGSEPYNDELPPDEGMVQTLALPMPQLPRQPAGAPRAATTSSPPAAAGAFDADADALVREALGMPDDPGLPGLPEAMHTAGWRPPLSSSSEGLPADELVLEQEDADFDQATVSLALPAVTAPPPFGSAPGSFDDDEIDALAAQAVQDALPIGSTPARPRPISAPSAGGTPGILGDRSPSEPAAAFVDDDLPAPAWTPPPPPRLPAEFSADDDGFDERTVAYGSGDAGVAAPAMSPHGFDDEDNIETGERKAVSAPGPLPRTELPPSSKRPVLPSFATPAVGLGAALVAPRASSEHEPPSGTSEFDPNEFDLPSDVKAILAARPAAAAPPLSDDAGASDVTGSFAVIETGRYDQIPSLASMDAEALIETAPPPSLQLGASSAPLADFEDAGLDLPSQSRSLFQVARGFEDDPANTFFGDELAEAEFFIQQDLLDEAREILTPILEDIEDSLRVQHMLARVAAKEAGEPEPPAPWEQKLIDEVGAQLDDMAALSPNVETSGPHQVSVAEVLSQFKKGVAETVPEDDAATHYDLGIAYREMGLLDDAISEFEIAARAPGRSADSFYVIALVQLEQGRVDDALAALERAFFSPSASRGQKAAAEYERGVIFDERKMSGREGLVCLKRSKHLGGNAPDLDRRIAALQAVYGDVDVPDLVDVAAARGKGINGNGAHKPNVAGAPGRPKNIDYV